MRLRKWIPLAALLFGLPLLAQEAAPPAPGPMAEECQKHCREMAAARQQAMADRKAAMEKMDATFKEVRAQLDIARTARGEKKVAALEAAIEKLVGFHEAMREQMADMPGMGPRGGMRMGHHGGMMGSCCGMHAMDDCPMMKGAPPPGR